MSFLLAAGTLLALSPQTPAVPRCLDRSTDPTRVTIVDRQPGHYLGHVSTVRLGDGAILAAYPLGHGRGAIVCKRSDDGGRTWSERLPVPASWSSSQEVPTLWRTVDPNGDAHVLLWSGLHPARLAHSEDDGAHWSELEPAGDWGGIVVMGDVVATATRGRYLAWFHDDGRYLGAGGRADGTFTLLQTETDDGGRTWSRPHAIWAGSDLHLCEPGAVRAPDGELALLLRENARRAPAQVLCSRDDGASWSVPRPLHPALCGDRHTVRRAADGRLVAVFRAMPLDGDAAFLATKGDFVAWVGRDADLRDGGGGQYRVRLLDNLDGWDCGYAGLEALSDGTFVATTYGHWRAGEPPYIVSVRFTLAELDVAAAATTAASPLAAAPAATTTPDAPPRTRADNAANDGTDAADVATLVAYHPTGKAPVDQAVVGAEARLQRALPRLVAADGDLARALAELLRIHRDELLPSRQHPIRTADPLARVLVRFDDETTRRLPVAKLSAHPAAAAFPGDALDLVLPTGTGKVLDLHVPGRRSLGVYARPGAIVTVRFGNGETAPPPGLQLRIGAHSDDIARRDAWPRMPRISRTFAVDRAQMRIGNAYGGLVYLEVGQPQDGRLDVVLDNIVPAPLFVLGTTTPDDWRKQQRAAPGPWAELAADKVVLTVPSAAIRALDDPTALLQFWDRLLDGAADLATRPRQRERPERYVADLEISAGAMHSGYPIMTHLGAVPDMIELARLEQGPWGLFHELGHNHQNRDWTFAGTGEVTVNLFSLYLCHVFCDVPWDQAWGGKLVAARDRLAQCLRNGNKPWGQDGGAKADLALRLLMYSQLERGFGWEAFMHTFAAYRDLPDDERPKTDQDKRDQWLVRMSTAVDRDLGPFFAAWGVEVSAAARAAVSGRAPWLPDDWPQ